MQGTSLFLALVQLLCFIFNLKPVIQILEMRGLIWLHLLGSVSLILAASGQQVDMTNPNFAQIQAALTTATENIPDEARIRTEDIGRVLQGQPAEIRFTAFKYRTTQLVDLARDPTLRGRDPA